MRARRTAAVTLLLVLATACAARGQRVTDGLVALYTFEGGQDDPSLAVATDAVSPSLLGNIVMEKDQVDWRANSIGIKFEGTGSRVSATTQHNISALVGE